MQLKSMDKKIIRFLCLSFFSVMIICIVVFFTLSVFMSNNTEKSIEKISQIYMSEVSEQIQQKFDSIINLRMAQVKGIIERTPPEEATPGSELHRELQMNAEVRRFTYLGFYLEDGSFHDIYGEPVELRDSEQFKKSLAETGDAIGHGMSESGEDLLLLGAQAAYPLPDGSESLALVAGVPMNYLNQALYLDTEGANVYSHVIDENGDFIIRNSDAATLNYFYRLLTTFDTYEGKTPEEYYHELKEAMAAEEDYSAYISVNGQTRHIYCSPLSQNTSWYLIAVMRDDIIDEPLINLDSARIRAVIGSVLVIMLVVVIIFVKYAQLSQRQVIALDKARNEAIQANRAKSQFLSNMSHDIRTPMNAIIGMTEIGLKNTHDAERVESCLKNVLLSSKHLLGLINDVLDMSKIESGKMTLNMGPISLREILADIVNITQPQIKEAGQHFDIFIRNILTENVCCDSVRLNQVLLNLLSNAIKFTPADGTINIYVYQEPLPDKEDEVRTHFIVEDTGIGMSEEFQKKIFDSFTRENNERVKYIVGTGLGMSITKNIVELMKGTIELTSEKGKGSKFHVTLDLKKAEPEEEMELPDWKILVVDDNEMLCTSAASNLEELGVKAEWTTDVEKALQLITERHDENDDCRFVLIDWKMPHMDGLQMVREIRQRVGDGIPMFLISAYHWGEIEEEIKAAKIEGFISKPLFKSTLYHCLKKYSDKASAPEKDEVRRSIDFTGRRLLIAEDIEINWIVAREALKSFGFETVHAINGQDCVEQFEQSEIGYFDAILMDIRMPVMNGYDATRAIRKLERTDNDVPIIAMTADAFSDDVKTCLDCGMNAHVAKPLDIRDLTRTLQQCLEASGDGK